MLYDVVVVGAGVAGLTAAHKLQVLHPDVSLLVLEATDRVGGRTLTQAVEVGEGRKEKFDLGGQWIGSSQRHVVALTKELGLATYPQYTSGVKVMQLGGDKVRAYSGDIPSLGSLWSLVQLQLFIWKAERLAARTPVLDPGSSPHAAQLDGETVLSFMTKNISCPAAIQAIDVGCKAAFGTEASRISLMFFLAYANAAGGVMKVFETKKDAAQETKVKGGTQQISELLAEKIGGDNLLLNHPVVEVDQTGNVVVIVTENGKRFTAKRAIFTAPPNLLIKLKFNPPFPPYKKLVCESLPMGHLTKFIVIYKKTFWRDKGYSGEIVSNGGRTDVGGVSSGPLSACFDATTDRGTPAIVGFIAGRQGIEWQNKTAGEREAAVVGDLCTMLGEEARSYVTYVEKVWSEEPYVGGCPVVFGVPGTSHAFPHLRLPFLRVHFAGTETATEWTGFISGAVQSGERAALEVLHTLRPGQLTEDDLKGTCHDPACIPKTPARNTEVTGGFFSLTTLLLFLAAALALTAVIVSRWYS